MQKILIVSTPSGQGDLFEQFKKFEKENDWGRIEWKKEEVDLCKCGAEAEIGCHGIRNREVYSEHWCEDCYNAKKKKQSVDRVSSRRRTALSAMREMRNKDSALIQPTKKERENIPDVQQSSFDL